MTDYDEQRWASARPRVHSVAIELTAFCNQRCDYCYNAWRDDGGASLGTPETATVLARIDRVLDAVTVEHVTLTGGEPLASHSLFPVLEHLRARGVRAQMITNASLVTDALAARLARYRLLSALVTLNGPEAELHDALVGGAGFFARTVEGIALLRARRVPVEGSVVVTRRNAARVGDTLRLFRSLGVRKAAISRFSPAGYSVENTRDLMPSPDDVTVALTHAAAASREHAMAVFSTMPIPPCVVDRGRFPEVDFHDCPIGTARQEFALGPQGELRHCPLHSAPLGGIRDVLDPAADVAALLGEGDPHGYRAVLPSHCEGCAHSQTCAGGCGAAAWWAFGDRARPDPFVTSSGAPLGTPALTPGARAMRALPVVY
jgi:radical SAM protein with 4Fe4S-binding SPASM domain